MRTAVAFFWTFWPPLEEARKTSMRRSSGSRLTSAALSTSGITSTSANEVWRWGAGGQGGAKRFPPPGPGEVQQPRGLAALGLPPPPHLHSLPRLSQAAHHLL